MGTALPRGVRAQPRPQRWGGARAHGSPGQAAGTAFARRWARKAEGGRRAARSSRLARSPGLRSSRNRRGRPDGAPQPTCGRPGLGLQGGPGSVSARRQQQHRCGGCARGGERRSGCGQSFGRRRAGRGASWICRRSCLGVQFCCSLAGRVRHQPCNAVLQSVNALIRCPGLERVKGVWFGYCRHAVANRKDGIPAKLPQMSCV